jgi:hypothetical protein
MTEPKRSCCGLKSKDKATDVRKQVLNRTSGLSDWPLACG